MSSLLNSNIISIKPSPTLTISDKVSQLQAKGIDIIKLSNGEPDFHLQDNIKMAIINAISYNKTKYTPVDGIAELKKAIQNKYKNLYKLDYDLDQIILSTGAKQAIYNLFLSTLNQEDEVLIPSPYWTSYPDIVKICGGKPVIIKTSKEDHFKINANTLQAHITNKTKWLIINSPSNPTGSVYSKNELKEISNIIKNNPNLYVLSDDIYEHIIYDEEFYNLAMISQEIKNQVFIISGLSKTYSMTGLRLGYGIGNKNIVKAMKTIQSQSTSNPCSIIQYGALEALESNQDFIISNNNILLNRKNYLLNSLNKIMGNTIYNNVSGAFYLFPSCEKYFGSVTPQGQKINNSTDFSLFLLEEAKISVVPGIAFGDDRYFRISYSVKEELLEEAVKRIEKSLKKLY